MPCLRAVAGFAVNVSVFPLGLGGDFVGVAGLAGIVTGEFHRMRCDFGHGRGPIVAVLPEGFGDDVSAYAPEHQKSDNEEACKSKKMSSILEKVHPGQTSRDGKP